MALRGLNDPGVQDRFEATASSLFPSFPPRRRRGRSLLAEERRKRELRGTSRGGTLLTGPQGVLGEPASVRRPTLLGG